jgi:CotS family spore coat protein
MDAIKKEIADVYNLDIKGIVPYRGIYIINMSNGKKALRKSRFSTERIEFIHGAKEHLQKSGFTNIDRYLCTIMNKPYVQLNGEIYTLSNYIEGRECNFESREDIIRAAELLAKFHKAAKGYIAPSGCRIKDELDKLPISFNKRLTELKRLKRAASKGKRNFDRVFLQHVDYFCDQADKVIKQIETNAYQNAVKVASLERTFCHHDFTHSNIIHSEDKVFLVNFDYSCYDLKVYDIANFIRRKMRKCNWNRTEARLILKKYLSIEDLSKDEIFVMKLMLQFPQKFWRVANKYYNNKRSWAEKVFFSKLEETISEIKYHESFMQDFDSLL